MRAIRPSVSQRRPWVVLTIIGCATAVAGCGSSGNTPNNSASRSGSFLAFSACMRSHGVPSFPDPNGHGIDLNGTGLNPASPSFEAAQAICKKLLPGGGPSAQASEQQKERMFATSVCMRRHGVSGFPDPITRKTPPGDPQDYSIAMGTGDTWLLVPRTIDVNSPAFKQAARACGLDAGH